MTQDFLRHPVVSFPPHPLRVAHVHPVLERPERRDPLPERDHLTVEQQAVLPNPDRLRPGQAGQVHVCHVTNIGRVGVPDWDKSGPRVFYINITMPEAQSRRRSWGRAAAAVRDG